MVDVGDHDRCCTDGLGCIVYEGDFSEADSVPQAEEAWNQSSASSWRHSNAFTEASTGIFQTAAYDVDRGKLLFPLRFHLLIKI